MRGNQPPQIVPDACFVVKREPTKGYQVTSAEGPNAEIWRDRALTLLDAVGQPDPKGPTESFCFFGPITPSGEYVAVSVKMMSNGEARYKQAWFSFPSPISRSNRSISLLILVSIVGLVVGAIAGNAFPVLVRTTPSDPKSEEAGGGKPKPESPANDPPLDAHSVRLKIELVSSKDVRTKLKRYFSQEGLAANTSVIDKKSSVKLIADLDTTPPPRESIRLNNFEVAKLLKVLDSLDDWSTYPKPSPMPEGR